MVVFLAVLACRLTRKRGSGERYSISLNGYSLLLLLFFKFLFLLKIKNTLREDRSARNKRIAKVSSVGEVEAELRVLRWGWTEKSSETGFVNG